MLQYCSSERLQKCLVDYETSLTSSPSLNLSVKFSFHDELPLDCTKVMDFGA